MDRAGGIIEHRWAHKKGILGRSVGIVCFDTGLATEHLDFRENGKIKAFYDCINKRVSCYDDNGHGTHVAGIASGTGKASMGQYIGVAPKSHLIIVKILNQKGSGNIEDVLIGIDWVIKNRKKFNIRIANISIGTGSDEHMREDSELVQAVNAMWDYGIIVCVAAGNNGPEPGSIGAPGNSRKIITVGTCDDKQEVWINGRTVREYSGRGPTYACIKKPDFVAPGSNIVSCNAFWNRNNFFYGKKNFTGNKYYTTKSGTSMSTPMVTGAIALLLEKYPEMTNREVKIRLKQSVIDLGYPHEIQGWGELNIKRLLK